MGCSVTKTKIEQNLNKSTTDKFESYLMTQSLVQFTPVSQSKQYSIEKNPIMQRRKQKLQQQIKTPLFIDKDAFSA